MSDHIDRVYLGDPNLGDEEHATLAIATNTDTGACWLEMWFDGRVSAETTALTDQQRKALRSLLA